MLDLPFILLLAPFTMWWYLMLVVCIPLAFWAMDDEDTLSGIIWLSVFFCAANVLFGAGTIALEWMFQNPVHVLCAVGGYLSLGVGWCLFRWYSLVRRARELYKKLAVEGGAQQLRSDVKHYISSRWPYKTRRGNEFNFRPRCNDYKARITNWIAYWPLSVIWVGIREWVRDLLNMVYNSIAGLLERVSVSTWNGVDE